ncbi:MAG: hypothetical protein GY798_34425 [Hyphomicrobiales bacterium]|nr:hypothetical protein [Hyphomicrobiales bacterium]
MFRTITRYGWLTAAVTSLLATSTATAETTPIRVEINHAEIIRLDSDAHVVHIANPAVADVVLESPRLLFVVGLAPGETGLFVLDANGQELINTDLLVTPNLDHEVTVNRNAIELTYSCSPRCVVTNVPAMAAAGSTAGSPSGATLVTPSVTDGAVNGNGNGNGTTNGNGTAPVDGGDVETGN